MKPKCDICGESKKLRRLIHTGGTRTRTCAECAFKFYRAQSKIHKRVARFKPRTKSEIMRDEINKLWPGKIW